MLLQRQDIRAPERVGLVATMIGNPGEYGLVSRVARDYRLSRQTLYTMLHRAQDALSARLSARAPGRPGPALTLAVDRNRLDRAITTLTTAGHASAGNALSASFIGSLCLRRRTSDRSLARRETFSTLHRVSLSATGLRRAPTPGGRDFQYPSPGLSVCDIPGVQF